MVRRLKENKVTGILTALLVGIVMFVGMGTMKVNATEYRSGTIDPTTLQVGDTVYVGVELSSDKQIVVCKQCHMIWITYGGSSQYGRQNQFYCKEIRCTQRSCRLCWI